MHAVALILGTLVVSTYAVSRPPGFTLLPSMNIYYKAKETVQMPCAGSGDPYPTFYWKRNEFKFEPSGNDDRIVQLPNTGTLVFNNPEDKDEGLFQCFAENDFGISASIVVNFREAKLEPFAVMTSTNHRARLGLPLTLPCVPPESIPPPKVVWMLKGPTGLDPYNYDLRVTMDREYRLRFANILQTDRADNRAYVCVANNNIMRKSVQGPEHYIIPDGTSADYTEVRLLWSDQDDRFGLKGDVLSVMCIFSGNPTPDVHWERTDNKPFPADRMVSRNFAQELQITDLQFEDEGNYECWATNEMSQRRALRTFQLRVQSRPYFIQKPENIETSVGADIEITCTAGGRPDPDINWYINGVPLEKVTDPRINGPNSRFKRPLTNKVFFENIQETDSLVIQCNASNIHGYVYSDTYINVLNEAPTILTPPEARKVSAEGRPVNLTCETTGKPDPVITWFKDGDQITGGRYGILPTGDLHIRSTVLADAGHYRCQAKNMYNTTSAEGTLVVRRKTRIEQAPKDLEVNAGTDAKFTCSGTTDPEEVQNLQIIWLKDGKPIMTNDQRMFRNIQDSSLTISGTIQRDSGTYTCIATNGLDNHTSSAMLIVKDRPDPPTNVYHEFCNENATIHWMPGSFNNAPVQYYVLQYNTSFNQDQWHYGLQINSTLSKVNMTLSPYVNYTFRIIAYNKIGPSDPSLHSPKVCTTTSRRPAHHPRNLRTLGHEPGKLYIEWTPMPQIQHNGPGFRYKLEILRVGAPESELLTRNIDNWETNYFEMSTGRVYERFRITLKAENNDGEAAEDPPTIIGHSYESKPTITPQDVVVVYANDTSAKLSWTFDKSQINKVDTLVRGEFRGFKIQFWEQNYRSLTVREHDVGPESAAEAVGNTFSAVVEDMLPNTNMEAQVAVKNNFYIGQPSEVIRFRTLPGLPGPVEFFRPITIGDTHVNLEWSTPFEDRGDLLGYDISYQLVRGLDLGEMQEREPQINDKYTTNAYLSGLSPNSKYRIHIFARTEKGRGEGYFIETTTAKPGMPRMPRFTIADVSRTYINVSWWINAYATSGTIIFVEYRKLDGPEWLRTTDEVVNTWKNVSNLEPGQTYEVRIKATNGQTSIASGIEEIKTDGTALAYDLVGNYGWFVGMLLALILIIALIVVFFLCYKHGFRFAQRDRPAYYGGAAEQPYSGTYDNTTRMDHGSEHFGPEPRGYNNDYYDERDNYHNYEDGENGSEKRPPSYNSDDYRPEKSAPPLKEYEAYNARRPSDNYDPDYDGREPHKFDRNGRPVEYDRQNHDDYDRGDYPDDYGDDYRDDYRGDYREDYDDDYRRRHDDYDRGHNYEDYRDDRRDDYEREQPRRSPPSDGNGKSSSTFV